MVEIRLMLGMSGRMMGRRSELENKKFLYRSNVPNKTHNNNQVTDF